MNWLNFGTRVLVDHQDSKTSLSMEWEWKWYHREWEGMGWKRHSCSSL